MNPAIIKEMLNINSGAEETRNEPFIMIYTEMEQKSTYVIAPNSFYDNNIKGIVTAKLTIEEVCCFSTKNIEAS